MTVEELLATAEQLPLTEQLQLITSLLEKICAAQSSAVEPRYQWAAIGGAAPHPLMGEDAQSWVSRSRADADAHREDALH